MPLTDEELRKIRVEIGPSEPPADFELEDMFTRLASVTAVIREVIRERIAILVNGQPIKWSLPGEYSEDRESNLKALQAQLADLEEEEEEAAAPSTITALRLRRDPGFRRSPNFHFRGR